MRLGVFDHMDRGPGPLDQFFADRMRLVEAYDRAGFYGYHVAEHHATPLGVAPSPGVWLAAIAQRTTQLRFGALVYLLPLYHPLKLLEELCMLDQMSRGRLLLGVGRGISPIELRYYGLDPAQTPAMYQEALEIILRGMACKELTFEGIVLTNITTSRWKCSPVSEAASPCGTASALARCDSVGGAASGQRGRQRHGH